MLVEMEKILGKDPVQRTCGIGFILGGNGNGVDTDDACSTHTVQLFSYRKLTAGFVTCARCYLQHAKSENRANSNFLYDG